MNLLMLANTPSKVMRKGAGHERDSVIDLVWYNEIALLALMFSDLTIDWEGSMGSDHVMLHVLGHTNEPPTKPNRETDLGFVVDPEKGEEWVNAFKRRSHASSFQLMPTEANVEEEAAAFTADIHSTNEEIFRK